MAGSDKGFLSGGMTFGTGDDTGPEERATLLPLRMLVVADLVPRDPHNAGASAPDAALRVDAQRFDELFQRLRPRIAVDVPSVLAEGRNARVDLAPTSLKSFRPDGLCAELPLLRSLLDGRLVLERLREGALGTDQARAELERLWAGSPFAREVLGLLPATAAPAAAPTAGPASASGGALDSILSLVDVGSGAAAAAPAAAPAGAPAAVTARSKLSDLIASVAKSGKSGSGRPVDPSEAIARVEKALGAQIGAILQHPEVRRLESAWRGIRFLVERAQMHTGIRIEVVSARPDESAKAIARVAKTGAGTEPPVSCAIVDVDIDGSPRSFALLEEIASAAEAITAPAVVNASQSLFARDLAEIERLDNKQAVFEAPDRAPWRSAAARPPMQWVSAVANPVLARSPYDKATSRIREAVVKELPADDGGFVWLSPAWVVGALVLSSFRATGWPCRIVGPREGGVCENLPVRELRGAYEGEDATAIPTLAFLSTDTQKELAKMGVLALACAPNSDATIVTHAPTFYVPPPKRTYDSATTEPEARLDRVPLVDQLFVGRIVQFLRALCAKLPPQSDPGEVGPIVKAAIWELFDKAPPGMEIEAQARAGKEGTSVQVLVRPRRFLGVGLEEIGLEMPLG